MTTKIHVAILEDHQSIIDGYSFRLSNRPGIEIVVIARVASELEPLLAAHPVDVLLLDINVPTSATNHNPYPLLHVLPKLKADYPNLQVLVISMSMQRSMIRLAMESGASGYILKDDYETLQDLEAVVRSVAHGGKYLSHAAYKLLMRNPDDHALLTKRQLETLALCIAYPNETTGQIAQRLKISDSTVRSLLSEIYKRLDVSTRTAAIAKAHHLGLIPPAQ